MLLSHSFGIAAQVVIRRGFLDSANLSELRNTNAMINAVSTSGCLPVAFTLFCLHAAGMESWYLSVLTVCTVVIATATGFLTGNFQPSAGAIARLNRTTINFESCGHRNPVAFCQTPYVRSGRLGEGYANTPLIISLMVTLLIMTIQCVKHVKNHHSSLYSHKRIDIYIRTRARSMGIEVYLKMRTTIPKSIRSNVNSICYFALWALSVVLYYNFRVVLVALIPSISCIFRHWRPISCYRH